MTNPTATQSGRVELLSPDGLIKSPAFSNVAVVSGPVKTIYIGGQDAITAEGELVGKGDLAARPRRSWPTSRRPSRPPGRASSTW